MNRRLTLATLAVASALVAAAPAAHAQQDYLTAPIKPIKLIVDGPAGGINDMGARRDANARSAILAKAAGVYPLMTQAAFADVYRQEIAQWQQLSTDSARRVEP